jgi:hypothetical protein
MIWNALKIVFRSGNANGGDRSTEDRLIEIIKAYNYLKTVVRA